MEERSKEREYAIKLATALKEVFDEDNENHIDLDELKEGDNLTHFIHAIGNLVPTTLYNQFTGEDKNTVEFNHTANMLCIKYMISEESKTKNK